MYWLNWKKSKWFLCLIQFHEDLIMSIAVHLNSPFVTWLAVFTAFPNFAIYLPTRYEIAVSYKIISDFGTWYNLLWQIERCLPRVIAYQRLRSARTLYVMVGDRFRDTSIYFVKRLDLHRQPILVYEGMLSLKVGSQNRFKSQNKNHDSWL